MGASDYMTGNAPTGASYSAPLVGFQLGQSLAAIPQQIFEGQQRERTTAMQHAFSGGLPRDASGQIDTRAMAEKLFQLSGGDAGVAASMLDNSMTESKVREAYGQQGASPSAAGPANLTPQPQGQPPQGQPPQAQPQGQPRLAANGGDVGAGPGKDNIRSLATEFSGGKDAIPIISATARALRINPDSALSPEDIDRAKGFMRKAGGQPERQTEPEPETNGQTGDRNIPFLANGSSKAPAPKAGPATPTAQPEMRQSPVGTQDEARKAFVSAERKEMAAASIGKRNPQAAAAMLATAKADRERGEKILASIGEYNKPTPEQLNSRDTGVLKYEKDKAVVHEEAKTGGRDPLDFARQGEIQKADTKYYDSLHKGLAGSGMIAAQQKQNIDMLRQVAAAPSFTPGAGSELFQMYQRAAAQFGINTTGAAPREIFNQVSARILADQFSGLKSLASETGETGARIFKSMLDVEEKANITPHDSIEGIRAKLELLDKTGDLMMKWADKADDYKLKHGSLDAGFDKELRAEIAKARVENAVPKAPSGQGKPPVEGARQAADGKWYVADPNRAGKYLMVR